MLIAKNLILVLLSNFLPRNPVFAYITRLPDCKYSANFTQLYKDQYFQGTIGRTITGSVNQDQCSAFCLTDVTCVFFNHKMDDTKCELMASHIGNLKPKSGWRHATTDYLNYNQRGPACRSIEMDCEKPDKPVNLRVCMDMCTSPGYACEPIKPIAIDADGVHVQSEYDGDYLKENLIDGKGKTAWGSKDEGLSHHVIIDLKKAYSIYLIRIVNYLSTIMKSRKYLSVYISNIDKNTGYVAVSKDKILKYTQQYKNIYMRYNDRPVVGRFVKVERKNSIPEYTTFGEIIVYGHE